MTWFRAGGGNGVPAALKSEMNDVLNKKLGTSTDYPPNDWPDTVDLMGPLEEKTVSGPIASFSDGADDVPFKSLVADLPASLTPYKKINVYHAGKNLLDLSNIVNGDYTGTGAGFVNNVVAVSPMPIKGGANYIMTCSSSVSGFYFRFYDENDTEIIDGRISAYNVTSKTFSTPANAVKYIPMWYNANGLTPADVINKNYMIEAGSTATTYEPYQEPDTYNIEIPNPNPNLFDRTAEHERATWNTDGSLNTDNYDHFAYRIAVEEKTAYTIAGEWFDRMIVFFDSNDNFISYVQPTMTDNKMKVTTPAGAAVMGVSIDFLAVLYDNSIKKDFNVYGGSIEAISGEGKPFGRVELGSLSWVKVTSGQAPYFASGALDPSYNYVNNNPNALVEGYTQASIGGSGTVNGFFITDGSSVRIRDDNYTSGTADEFKAAMSGKYVIYELATPGTFQTEPISVNSKAGSNNIWNDAGDSSVTYRSAGTMTPVLPTLIEKTITENGEYLASSDNADGFSKVTVNVESITKIGINSGKLNIANGTITADSAWCYTDTFDCPSGNITMDFGESDLNVGIELVNASDNSHANYWSCGNDLRYREVDISSYYSPTKKARLSFKKANLSKVLLMDFGNGKIYSPLTAAQFEETQTE